MLTSEGVGHPIATWAKCPHQLLLQYVLGVQPVEEPERLLEMSALDKGSLIQADLRGDAGEVAVGAGEVVASAGLHDLGSGHEPNIGDEGGMVLLAPSDGGEPQVLFRCGVGEAEKPTLERRHVVQPGLTDMVRGCRPSADRARPTAGRHRPPASVTPGVPGSVGGRRVAGTTRPSRRR
jgi:hypothetical protein